MFNIKNNIEKHEYNADGMSIDELWRLLHNY